MSITRNDNFDISAPKPIRTTDIVGMGSILSEFRFKEEIPLDRRHIFMKVTDQNGDEWRLEGGVTDNDWEPYGSNSIGKPQGAIKSSGYIMDVLAINSAGAYWGNHIANLPTAIAANTEVSVIATTTAGSIGAFTYIVTTETGDLYIGKRKPRSLFILWAKATTAIVS